MRYIHHLLITLLLIITLVSPLCLAETSDDKAPPVNTSISGLFTHTPRLTFVVGITPAEKTRYEASLASLETQLAADPTSEHVMAEKGNTLRLLGRYAEAVAVYTALLDKNPKYAPGWSGIGTVITEAYNPELKSTLPGYTRQDGIAAYEKSLELDPHNPVALTGMGYLYRFVLSPDDPDARTEYQQKALDAFNSSIEFSPDSVEAYTGRAMTWDDNEQSFSDLKQALARSPDSAEVNALLGLHTLEPSYIETALSLQPEQTYPWIYQGLIRENSRDFAGAIESLKTAQEKYDQLSPFPGQYPGIYGLLATISLEGGDVNETEYYVQEADIRFSQGGVSA